MYRSSIYGIPETITEGALNHLYKFAYHASLHYFDILKPTGLDLGNSFQDMGWSLYTFTVKDYAIGWGVFKSAKEIIKKYHLPESYGARLSCGMLISQTSFDTLYDKIDSVPKSDRTFYVYTIKILPEYTLGFGHSTNTKNCITIRNEVIPYKTDKMYLTKELLKQHCYVIPDNSTRADIDKLTGMNARLLTPFMTNDVMYNWKNIKPIKNAIKDGTLIPGDTEGLQKFIKDNNVQIHKPTIRERLFS